MTAPKNFIAYEGPKFTVEWYYTEDGKIPALEYFNSLNDDEKIKTLDLFKLMATEGKIYNQQKFRNEHDKIYAFKPKPHRFMCFFFIGKRIIVTNGFVKKKDDLPSEEKKRAMTYQRDYEERFKAGKYYETP
jgi:Gp49-like protein DUF891